MTSYKLLHLPTELTVLLNEFDTDDIIIYKLLSASIFDTTKKIFCSSLHNCPRSPITGEYIMCGECIFSVDDMRYCVIEEFECIQGE